LDPSVSPQVLAAFTRLADVLRPVTGYHAMMIALALFDQAAKLYARASPVSALETVTTSVWPDPESRLLTADEAATLLGPSFTAKKLYRLRGSMPVQAWVRKGGRLYFREGPFKRWVVMR
jgi:hypothetical protein